MTKKKSAKKDKKLKHFSELMIAGALTGAAVSGYLLWKKKKNQRAPYEELLDQLHDLETSKPTADEMQSRFEERHLPPYHN